MNDNSHIPRQLAAAKSSQLFQFKSLLAVEMGFWLGFVLQPVRGPRRHSIIVYFRGFSFIVQPKSICPVGLISAQLVVGSNNRPSHLIGSREMKCLGLRQSPYIRYIREWFHIFWYFSTAVVVVGLRVFNTVFFSLLTDNDCPQLTRFCT